MKWSISSSRTFAQCPRKWYYNTFVANSRDGNGNRKEAFILKKLQSISSWRGKLVDQVISSFIIPRISSKKTIDEKEALDYAHSLFGSQLEYAKSKSYRNGGLSSSESNRLGFCALLEFEYGNDISELQLENAWKDVEVSLHHFLNSDLLSELGKTSGIIAQRPLQFKFAEVNVSCTPDLIAFFDNKPPAIVDWKVFASVHKESWLQLGTYGLALSRVKPHRDFPKDWSSIMSDPTKIRLIEFQLLHNRQLEYSTTNEDMVDVEDYIYSSVFRMQQMVNGHIGDPDAVVRLVPTTRYTETCMGCMYRKICWSGKTA